MNRPLHSARGPVAPGERRAWWPTTRLGHRVHRIKPDDLLVLARSLRFTPAYFHALEAITEYAPPDAWHWRTLLETDSLRCDLLLLSPGGRIPLHDHLGMQAALLVLAGRISIERYDLLQLPRPQRRVARLIRLRVEPWGAKEFERNKLTNWRRMIVRIQGATTGA